MTADLPMPPESCAALIFDCDGTLADTMPAHFVAWTRTLARYGLTLPEGRFYALGGVPTVTIVRMLAEEAGKPVNAVAIAHEKENLFHEIAIEEVQGVGPVVAVAAAFRGKLPLAVATGSERWSAQRVLRRIGILEWFDTLVCAGDVPRPKPAPDIYLEAARRLGAVPERCVVYEDADIGIQGAHAAGMHVIDVRRFYQPRRIAGS